MRANITLISNALKCDEQHAHNVERYINMGRMINWNEASNSLINTITRAVNDKLLRDAPVKRSKPVARKEAPKAPKTASKQVAPKAGTKIAHALVIFNEMQVDGVRSSRQDIISALVNSMQISRQQAAGYYQNCKKKVG